MRLIVICHLTFMATMSSLAAFVNEDERGDLPLVTMEAILERDTMRVANVRWANADTLIADFTSAGENKAQVRLLYLNGILGAPVGESELSALAPDGEAVLQRTQDGWILRDPGAAGQTYTIDKPKDDESEFSYSTRRLPIWTPDSRYVAIVEVRLLQSKNYSPETIQIDGVSIIDFDRHSPIFSQQTTRIRIIDRVAGKTVGQFVIPGFAAGFAWGPDYSLYVSQVLSFELEPSTILLRFTPTDSEPRRVYHTPGRMYTMKPAVRPDGSLIALAVDADSRKWADFVSFVLIDTNTGEEVRRLTYDLPIAGDDYYWSTDGSIIYARVRRGGLDEVWSFPLKGKPRPLAQGPRRHFDLAVSPDGRKLSYQTKDGYGRRDIRVLDLESGEEEVVYVLDKPKHEFRLGKWRQIRWNSADGVQPYGFLFLPPDFDRHRRYPMLVGVHNGGAGSRLYLHAPFTLGVARGPLEWHAWAALGYVVFVPDYRSTGDYGPKVIAARHKKGEPSLVDDVKDITYGVRHMIRQNFIDPTRAAILGHSAGGARIYYLLTRHTELFAAAIIIEGIPPDPVSIFINTATGAFVGASPAGVLSDLYGGTLAQVPNRYKVNYMFDAYAIGTPTLILLGAEENGGAPHMPYEILYSILKDYQIPVRMLSFVEEGHTFKNSAAVHLAFEEGRRWLRMHMPSDDQEPGR